jgi:hydrogenase maturation protein HypF
VTAARAGPATVPEQRRRVHIDGSVQGVGFRPHAFRIATELGLAGWIRNERQGVVVELEGSPRRIDRCLELLVEEAPGPALVERVRSERCEPLGEGRFTIRPSRPGEAAGLPLPPDIATCSDCLAELLDPADRRYRYPFVNCSACGPRLTIAEGVPYDRATTTMRGFAMCGPCRHEYEDPTDRRFHAEPNACPRCGPRAWLTDSMGTELDPGDGDAVAAAATELRKGAILAVKGIGGFHLTCRADDDDPIGRLRERKRRPHRPLAVMVADLEGARALAHLAPRAADALSGPARPIVIAEVAPGASIAPGVAPGVGEVGVMLAYSPLHHLLVRDAAVPLVMTSANRSGEPIVRDEEEALERLGDVADRFLIHDRPIATANEDSVLRATGPEGAGTFTIRRSRGRVPRPAELPLASSRPLLACGADLKSTFCLAVGERAWVSQHIGDLGTVGALRRYRETVAHLSSLIGIEPDLIAHDLHPDYASTRFATGWEGVERIAVQHHHAHLAAVLAELGEEGPAVGVIFDGAGFGSDGTIWGGEVLVGDLHGFRRAAHLLAIPQPGGDAAVREPWRMACAWTAAANATDEPEIPAPLRADVDAGHWRGAARMAARRVASPWTSSVGRLFDAVAAICGVRAYSSYEGQAAAELEALCGDAGDPYPFDLLPADGGSPSRIDPRPAIRAIASELAGDRPVGEIAAGFHRGLARVAARAAAGAATEAGVDRIVLAGGVFHNRRLREGTCLELRRLGLQVLQPERWPAGDGAISLGQAAIAAARPAPTGAP